MYTLVISYLTIRKHCHVNHILRIITNIQVYNILMTNMIPAPAAQTVAAEKQETFTKN